MENERSRRKSFEHRDDLTGEHPAGDTGQLILFGVFLVTWILDSFVFGYSTFLASRVPWYVRAPVSVVILAAGGLLAWTGHRTVFEQIRETPRVISTGAFTVVRHPMYAGSLLLYLGLAFITMSVLSGCVWVVAVVFHYLISRYEEKLLVNRFGTAYDQYRKRVPMLLPIRLRRRSSST